MTLTFESATQSDIGYITALEYKNKESVGFLPTMAIMERVQRGTVLLGKLNNEPFGYLLYDKRGGLVNILQACIQYDARRKLYGAALYGYAVQYWNPERVALRCAADLEANLFWRSLGLTCVASTDGGKRRGRKINVWHHYIQTPLFIIEVPPAFQMREDCKYEETGFLTSPPPGFVNCGSLGKIAWRKA